jgi:hypothetical protein
LAVVRGVKAYDAGRSSVVRNAIRSTGSGDRPNRHLLNVRRYDGRYLSELLSTGSVSAFTQDRAMAAMSIETPPNVTA